MGVPTMLALLTLLLVVPTSLAAPNSRGFILDLAVWKCKDTCALNPSGTCISGPLNLPCTLVNVASGAKTGGQQERGLATTMAACAVKCALDPKGMCTAGMLGLPKPCALLGFAAGIATGKK